MKNIVIIILLCTAVFCASQAQLKEPNNVGLFLYENVEILDFAGPMEVFMQAGMNVYTIAPEKTIKAMNKLTITTDYTIDDNNLPPIDVFVIPGGDGAFNCLVQENVMEWVKAQTTVSTLNFSVCSGAYLFAKAGVLDNKKATTFHTLLDDMQQQYPKIAVLKGTRFVDNGREITTAGISAGIDGALYLVSRLKGNTRAMAVATNMEYDKWKAGEGYIVENPDLKAMLSSGKLESLVMLKNLYRGEVLNLGDHFSEKGNFKDAEKTYQYVTDNYGGTYGI